MSLNGDNFWVNQRRQITWFFEPLSCQAIVVKVRRYAFLLTVMNQEISKRSGTAGNSHYGGKELRIQASCD